MAGQESDKRSPREGERERGGKQDEEKEVGEGKTERKKQTPNSLFSLSNSNHREGEDGGMGERRKGGGGGREKEGRNMRQAERDSHTFLLQTEV